MKTSALAIACIFMTLGLTLALNYGGYGYSPFIPVSPPQTSNPLGIGQGGILIIFGIFFLFLLLLGNNGLFNFTSTSNTVPVTIVG